MPKIYFYKLRVDNGGAPCIQYGLLSLAICKPMIRCTACRDDLIFGFAADSLHQDNRLIYVAVVTEKIPNGDYFKNERFADRADCVYEWRDGRFGWRNDAVYHGPKDLAHDLGKPPDYPRANVLLSTDFRYFGANGSAEYKLRYPLIKKAVEDLGRGHRVRHEERLREEFWNLKHEVGQGTQTKVAGPPTSAPSLGVCQRSKSCGVLLNLPGFHT